MQIEKRFSAAPSARPTIESRASGQQVIVGYGAVFYNPSDPGTQYQMDEDVVERILPGAFDRALRERHDVRGLFNHDMNFILARTAAGTLTLSIDRRGLRYEIVPPASSFARHVVLAVERGDVSGSSFAFVPTADGVRWERESSLYVRYISDLLLFDVSPVTTPAYEAATAEVGGHSGRLASARDTHGGLRPVTAEEVSMTMRMLELDEHDQRERQAEEVAATIRRLDRDCLAMRR